MAGVAKQLICPRCGEVLADAVYRRWSGKLLITAVEGCSASAASARSLLGAIEPVGADAPAENRTAEQQERYDFVRRNLGELFYDLRCRQGHATLVTAPQITRAIRRTSGRWVELH